MRVGEPLEGGARRRVAGERSGERLGHGDLARRGVERQLDLHDVAGLRPRPLADGAVQADEDSPPMGVTVVRQVWPLTVATTGKRFAPSPTAATWSSSSTTAAAWPRGRSVAVNRMEPMAEAWQLVVDCGSRVG
jgi:hypothetical protein